LAAAAVEMAAVALDDEDFSRAALRPITLGRLLRELRRKHEI
jgi:hypothetical protein